MSNVEVKITADVVQLQAKFGVAKAESQALSQAFNKLVREAAQSGGQISAEMNAALLKASEAALNAKSRMTELGNAMKATQGGTTSLGSSFSALQQGLGALGITASVAELLNLSRQVIINADAIYHQAEVLGLSTDAFSGIPDVGRRRAGVETESVVRALERFNAAQGLAQEGSAKQAEAFRELGVDANSYRPETGTSCARSCTSQSGRCSKQGQTRSRAIRSRRARTQSCIGAMGARHRYAYGKSEIERRIYRRRLYQSRA